MASKWGKVSILSFEVASTVAKCSNLLQSVSPENIDFLKREILHSEGVQQLVSTDMEELLTIAAADIWEEFNGLCQQVCRYGDLCMDSQWHKLGRFFSQLVPDSINYKQLKKDAEMSMEKLDTLALHTMELYHQLNAFTRFEQEYQRKLEEIETLQLSRRGESLIILQSEIKHQRKLLGSLKKKSLWSLKVEEVVEELVDIVTFIHEEIFKAFEDNAAGSTVINQEPLSKPEKLGVAGLALHYANIITLINNIASRPTSFSANMRNTLYQWLPTLIKAKLPYKLQTVEGKEMLTIPQIKGEMEKTLRWLVPLALNTIKAHQGFHQTWLKESFDSNEHVERTKAQNNIMRLQTLYHADKMKVDSCIIELVIWLHCLIRQVIGSASWYAGTAMIEEYS
ncbi:hypothetical protein LguiB_014300 [Lonicera macranthoides]